MRLQRSSKLVRIAVGPALAMCLGSLVGCDSDGSDDNWQYGTDTNNDRTIDSANDDFESDRDLDRNTGAVDAPNGKMNTDEDWLRGGSGGVGGVDDTGRGTGRP